MIVCNLESCNIGIIKCVSLEESNWLDPLRLEEKKVLKCGNVWAYRSKIGYNARMITG